MERIRIIGLILATVCLSAFAYGVYALVTQLSIPGSGNVMVLNAYWDSGASQLVTQVQWGVLNPDSNTSKSIWVKNHGTKPLNLSMTVGDWTPTIAQDYLTITWNREGYNLTAGFIIECVLTLTVSMNVTGMGSFSHTILIAGQWS